MQIRFTKMQGAGNDFCVLDETRQRLGLSLAHYRLLADRHFGVGADQILTVRASPAAGIDFEYLIHNADGVEVEQCGNGARCFARFVREQGLSRKDTLRVQTLGGIIKLSMAADGLFSVDMGVPNFDLAALGFDAAGRQPKISGNWQCWPLLLGTVSVPDTVWLALVSMGNPHAVQLVADIERAPVALQGPLIERHARFQRGVNAGFMQVLDRSHVALRVFERGSGETLACGSGACAAVVAGIRLGLLDAEVTVQMRGGTLRIAWPGQPSSVQLSGPAETVFHGEIDLPDDL